MNVENDATTDDNVYGLELSEVYDLVYLGRARDYSKEAAIVARAVRAHKSDARSLLDVACGTGEHLVSLSGEFDHVEGVELSTQMCDRARAKLPDVAIHTADMRGFDLGRKFDAVCCLFSSISYMTSTDELDSAVAAMAAHVAPGGVLVIDPWYFPGDFINNYVSDATVHDGVQVVSRVSHSARHGRSVRQEAHFLAADSRGVRHFVTVQRMSLFSRDEYAGAIERAGCEVMYLEQEDAMSAERGMFVGVRRQG